MPFLCDVDTFTDFDYEFIMEMSCSDPEYMDNMEPANLTECFRSCNTYLGCIGIEYNGTQPWKWSPCKLLKKCNQWSPQVSGSTWVKGK